MACVAAGQDGHVTEALGEQQSQDPAWRATGNGMVVGIDGSEGSLHALRWAVAMSGSFGPVRPVVAWHYPWWAVPTGMPGGPPPPSAQEFADQARSEAEQALRSVDPALCSSLVVVEGTAGHVLVETGRDAAMVVVGTRGRGAVADAVLGSVSSHVVRHATVAVVVVPDQAPVDKRHHRVVVGADGSPNSVAALAWAIANVPADATVEAWRAWTYHLSAYPEVVSISVEVFEQDARASLEATVDAAVTAAANAGADAGREVVRHLEYGDPRNVLLAACEDADLLVMGARGHEGVAHLLVGSVTTSLVHKPIVPTVVVPASRAQSTI
jgi:nucleotide-binding universal stress UspA family protein